MNSRSIWKRAVIGVSVTACLIYAALILVSSANTVHAKPAEDKPLQLWSKSIPLKTLSATTPSNVIYTVTSSKGAFCLEGFVVSPGLSADIGPGQIGGASIALTIIDQNAVSHPYITLVDGASGGVSPLDIVLSYGNHICASHQLQFQATQWAGGSGPAVDIYLSGQAMILADSATNITIQ